MRGRVLDIVLPRIILLLERDLSQHCNGSYLNKIEQVRNFGKALGYINTSPAHRYVTSVGQGIPQSEESRAMLLNATLNQEKAPIHTKSDTQYRPSLKQSRREPRYSINLARLRPLPQPAPSFPTPILVRMRPNKRDEKKKLKMRT